MIRILATLLFLSVVSVTSNCHAQRTRGLFNRGSRVQRNAHRYDSPNLQQQLDRAKYSSGIRSSGFSRFYNQQSFDPGDGYPRYIGGFHYSHFNNIGIPSGDIGLRGNAYYWRPW